MQITLEAIANLSEKNVVDFYLVDSLKDIHFLELLESDDPAVTVTLKSLVTVLFMHYGKMNVSEKNIFEAICSYFTRPEDQSQWVRIESLDLLYIAFDFPIFSTLLQKAYRENPVPMPLGLYESDQEVLAILNPMNSGFKGVVLRLNWGL